MVAADGGVRLRQDTFGGCHCQFSVAEGYSAVFMTAPDLLDHLRAAFNPASETAYDDLFEQLRNTPLLILTTSGHSQAHLGHKKSCSS